MKYIMDNSISARLAEIEHKVASLRAEMANKKWDAVYISKSEHFAWITAGGDNIVTRFVEGGICGILVTAGGRYFICNNIETPRMLDEEFLDQFGFKELSMKWYESKTMELVRGVLGKGVLAADIPLPRAVDCNAVLLEMEKVLTENEIGRYIHMGNVFSEVIENFMTAIRPGESEKEIAGRLGAKMWENGLEPVLYLVAADERIYKYRHPVPTENLVKKFLMISCNARYKGLVTKITRMMYFGRLPEELREQYAATVEIENLMASATKPGTDDIRILDLAKELYAKAGCTDMWKLHHQGGPQSYTNGFYLISENAHGIIKENMIYGYNPSITGTKTEDAFAVTAQGPLFMTYPVIFPAIRSEIAGVKYSRPGILEIQ
jgi:Xaa-Pro dipeptidase